MSKKVFVRELKKEHPDKGGDLEKVYIFNKYGIESDKNGRGSQDGFRDLLSGLFVMSGNHNRGYQIEITKKSKKDERQTTP